MLVLLGIGSAAAQAWWRWGQVERAARCRTPLPAPVMTVLIAAGSAVAAVLVLVGLLVR